MNGLSIKSFLCAGSLLLSVVGCSHDPKPTAESRYVEPDKLYHTLEHNVRANPELEVIVDIDHSRLAAKAGSSMPPAHVLIWSDSKLEADILKLNRLAAIDLPLRALVFEDQGTGKAAVISNSFGYIAHRHSLPDDEKLRARYEAAIGEAMKGIPDSAIAKFPFDKMQEAGLVTLKSSHDFAATEKRVLDAINAQTDTVSFGVVDFSARSKKRGVTVEPMRLILFGGPGPGGKAMKSAPTLGLDAFCQKLLIWQDADGTVRVTFNDLLVLAQRQQVSGGIVLRIINRRLRDTFAAALGQ